MLGILQRRDTLERRAQEQPKCPAGKAQPAGRQARACCGHVTHHKGVMGPGLLTPLNSAYTRQRVLVVVLNLVAYRRSRFQILRFPLPGSEHVPADSPWPAVSRWPAPFQGPGETAKLEIPRMIAPGLTADTCGDPRQAENAQIARTRHVSKPPISDATIQRRHCV